MSMDPKQAMRDFMTVVAAYTDDPLTSLIAAVPPPATLPQPLVEAAADPPSTEPALSCLLAESRDLIFKLRSYTEIDAADERALGIEQGYARAADMLENLLARHGEG